MADMHDREAGNTNPAADHRSTGALLSDLVNELSALFRGELQLFRAELGEKTNQAFAAVAMIVAGIVLALVGLNSLMAFLIGVIAALGLGTGWAALIAGILVAIVGYLMVKGGTSKLKSARLNPDRTARSLGEDKNTAKEIAR